MNPMKFDSVGILVDDNCTHITRIGEPCIILPLNYYSGDKNEEYQNEVMNLIHKFYWDKCPYEIKVS